MINTHNDKIIIKQKYGDLNESVKHSLQTTINLLLGIYCSDVQNIEKKDVTSKYKPDLVLLKVVADDAIYNEEWLNNIYDICLNRKPQTVFPNDFLMVFPNVVLTKTLAKHLLKNLRLLFMVLWCEDVVILTLRYSLPMRTRKTTTEEKEATKSNRHGAKGIHVKVDLAFDVYTEVMRFIRKPFCGNNELKDNNIPDLLNFTSEGEFIENVHSYIPRILMATDWHSVEDITTEELNKMASHFEEMRRRMSFGKSGSMIFPVSIKTEFAYYLYQAYPDRCKFDLESVHHGKPGISIKNLKSEIKKLPTDLVNTEKKEAWLEIEEEYIYNLKHVRRKKAYKFDEKVLSSLNKYLFSILPNDNVETPYPSEFDRKYLSRNKTDIPSLYDFIKARDDISAIQRFFDFMHDADHIKKNPVIDFDKPLERKSTQSSKTKLTITQFRLVLNLGYTLESFIWYVSSKIKDNELCGELIDKLTYKNVNRVISTEEFGYVPILEFTDTSKRAVRLPLKWIPVQLLNVQPLTFKDNRKVFTPTSTATHAFLVALETGLRGIHVRWLERHDLPVNKLERGMFNLIVNTDKVKKKPWVRPTVSRVYTILKKQISTHSWYRLPWANDCFHYDGHMETDYKKIYPLFLSTGVPGAISDSVLRASTKEIYLFANIIYKGLYGELMQNQPLKHFDLKNIDLKSYESYNLPTKFWKQRTAHTVHSMRTSVTSAAATVLPNHIIGKYITGHETDHQVSYYTILDSDFIEDTKSMNKAMCNSPDDFSEINTLALAAEKKGAALVEAYRNGGVEDIVNNFGGFSFSFENSNGKISSGIDILNEQYETASIEPTHICPFGNICPPDIIKMGLQRKCGQCWYSVKTIDHLPRILGLCHKLSLELKSLNEKLEYAANNDASDKVLSTIEAEMIESASELAAWLVTSEYLSECHRLMQDKTIDDDNITLIRKPDLLKSNIKLKTATTELESLLVMCDEASNYPEFISPEFELKIKKVRNQILIKTERLHEALEDYSQQPLIDNFRGIVTSICKITGLSLNELDEALANNEVKVLSSNPTSLMENTND